MVNDMRVCERLAQPHFGRHWPRPAEMRYHYLLGVKWSQVQILSARPKFLQVRGGFGEMSRPLDLDSGLDRNAHDGDLIMVGSSRLSAPKRLFLGSTSAKMLRVLDVPMVVVPRPVDAQMNAVDLTGAQIRGAVFQRESDAGRH
jgi:Universal stress protein family